MSPSAVLSADELGNNRAVVHLMTIAIVISGEGKCIPLSVPRVAKHEAPFEPCGDKPVYCSDCY
jgi:hypothetical protein